MLNPRGQRGLEAKIIGLSLGLAASGLVLGLMHEGCPHGLVVSRRNDVIYVMFFSDRNFWLLYDILFKLTVEKCIYTAVTAILGVISRWY